MPIEFSETDYGYRSISTNPVSVQDVLDWSDQVKALIRKRGRFSQIVEVRKDDFFNDPPEVVAAVTELMEYIVSHGLKRSVVLVPNRRTVLRIMQMSFDSGVYEWERYIELSRPDCEKLALDWILKGIDPDDQRSP